MRFLFLTILLAIFSLTTITKSDDTKKNDSVFVPTKEWQKVRKGEFDLGIKIATTCDVL